MSNAPSIYPDIEKMVEPTEKDLVKLFRLYHTKIGYENLSVIHEKSKVPIQFYITPSLGYILNQNKMYGGLTSSIGMVKSNERLFLKAGLYIENYKSETQINQKLQYLIRCQFEYRFPQKTIQPMLAYGLNYNLTTNDLVPVLTTNVNIWLSKQIALTIAPEFYLSPLFYLPVIPTGFISYNLIAGLQIKI